MSAAFLFVVLQIRFFLCEVAVPGIMSLLLLFYLPPRLFPPSSPFFKTILPRFLPPPRPKHSLSLSCWQRHEKAAGSLCLECLQVINSASSYPQPFSSAKWLNALALNGKPLLMPFAQTSPFTPLSFSIATSQISPSKSANIYICVGRFIKRKWGHYTHILESWKIWWRPSVIHFLVKAERYLGFIRCKIELVVPSGFIHPPPLTPTI